MLQAGMFDARPRSRELIYVLLGAARGAGARRPQDARERAHARSRRRGSRRRTRRAGGCAWTRNTVRGEQHLYLQQPAYGTSYIIGKIQIEGLLAARKRQLGDAFTIKRFMDEFNAVGLIPASLVHWEMTGERALTWLMADG